jgi:hypothetical protein
VRDLPVQTRRLAFCARRDADADTLREKANQAPGVRRDRGDRGELRFGVIGSPVCPPGVRSRRGAGRPKRATCRPAARASRPATSCAWLPPSRRPRRARRRGGPRLLPKPLAQAFLPRSSRVTGGLGRGQGRGGGTNRRGSRQFRRPTAQAPHTGLAMDLRRETRSKWIYIPGSSCRLDLVIRTGTIGPAPGSMYV